ncbi:MAG: hypothetical protein JJU02_03700, partial [Cryomorphaceae bacterium]|nr:hypothetical protein [Cryomorphaceae bacterium]
MKKFLISCAILLSSLTYGQIYNQFQLGVHDMVTSSWLPAYAPDSILVEIDTVPGTPFQAVHSFYIQKSTQGHEYFAIKTFPTNHGFYAGSRQVLLRYPCGQGDTIKLLNYFVEATNANNDTIIFYGDTTNFCPGTNHPGTSLSPPAYNIHVKGEVNSSGQIDPVNDHTYLILIGDNGAGVVSVVDSAMPSPSGNSRTFNNLNTTMLYTVVAIPQGSHPYLFQNNLPTYLGDESNWSNAIWNSMPSTGTVSDTITLVSSNSGGGNGTAGGNVNGGSPRGTTTDPVENMLMVLTDLSGQIIDFEFTDANGD